MANPDPSPRTRIVGQGKGTKSRQKGYYVRFPEPYDSMLASMSDKVDFIRQAVIEKLNIKAS